MPRCCANLDTARKRSGISLRRGCWWGIHAEVDGRRAWMPDPAKREGAAMRLGDEAEAMRRGEMGAARQWAVEHQIRVGTYLGAQDLVPVRQAHIMADTESLGET